MVWSADLAYVVGLITTDGNLSIDGRHINLTSKDLDQIKTFSKILNLHNKIGIKASSHNPNGIYYQMQFGNVELYRFLLNIGLFPNKTKTLGKLEIPKKYFPDFLRGHLDGDGYTYAYWDKRWKNSFMLYTGFLSASKKHLEWLSNVIENYYQIAGKVRFTSKAYRLVYAKKNSLILLKKLYYKKDIPSLTRKRFKIEQALGIIQQHAGVVKLEDTLA